MFIIQTYVAHSIVHGNGVFAGEDLYERQPIWRFAPGLDLVVPFDVVANSPRAFQDYMEMYAYVSPLVGGGMVLSCDHAKFINHCDDPNTVIDGHTTGACRRSSNGEESTCDYRICVADWSGHF